MSEDVRAEPLRIVLADDDPAYREGLARQLREHGVDVVADVSNGARAIRAAAELAPDAVVMDLSMPGLSGPEATRRLTKRAPASRVLVLSVSADEADIADAILGGAMGYVLKDAPVEEIVAGIRATAAGQSVIPPQLAAFLMQSVRDAPVALIAPVAPAAAYVGVPLSDRELEVLGLLADGRSNPEIADSLVISLTTVRKHISNILIKLQVENRVQAAVHAIRHDLV